MDADPALIDDLVAANRILYREGALDAFGHVSARHPARPDRYLISRNLAPAQVTAADLQELDLDGNQVAPTGASSYMERFIHGEIYKLRPDVAAVVHTHSPSVVPFSVSRAGRLRAMWHMGGFLGAGARVFEIRDEFGPGSDLLISDAARGRALGGALGADAVILMRGHGITVVGRTLREAVFRAVYAEHHARAQLEAMRLGEVVYLTEAEAAATVAMLGVQGIERAWNLWKSRIAN